MDLAVGVLRHEDAAGIAFAFEPHRHVDAAAVDVTAVGNHVADVDAETELQAAVRDRVLVAPAQAALDFDRAGDATHRAGEFRQKAVASVFDNAALVLGDGRLNDLRKAGLEPGVGSLFVRRRQAGISHHIGGKDRREFTLCAVFDQWAGPNCHGFLRWKRTMRASDPEVNRQPRASRWVWLRALSLDFFCHREIQAPRFGPTPSLTLPRKRGRGPGRASP